LKRNPHHFADLPTVRQAFPSFELHKIYKLIDNLATCLPAGRYNTPGVEGSKQGPKFMG